MVIPKSPERNSSVEINVVSFATTLRGNRFCIVVLVGLVNNNHIYFLTFHNKKSLRSFSNQITSIILEKNMQNVCPSLTTPPGQNLENEEDFGK